ncbi:unnamed protein product, partial [Staurois parvus]
MISALMISSLQCHPPVPSSATHQCCPEVAPSSAAHQRRQCCQCHQSASPVSVAHQCPSVVPISVHQ